MCCDVDHRGLRSFPTRRSSDLPANVSASGDVREKYRNRRNITYQQALHYYRLMEGEAREICLKCFAYEVKGQAVYNGVKTDRKSTRLNSSHRTISYAVFCLKKK